MLIRSCLFGVQGGAANAVCAQAIRLRSCPPALSAGCFLSAPEAGWAVCAWHSGVAPRHCPRATWVENNYAVLSDHGGHFEKFLVSGRAAVCARKAW